MVAVSASPQENAWTSSEVEQRPNRRPRDLIFLLHGRRSRRGRNAEIELAITMVGQSPIRQRDRDDRRGRDDDRGGRTPWIPGPIIPVNLELHEPGGAVLFLEASVVVGDGWKSPTLSFSDFSSARRATQHGDAVHASP